MLGSSQNYVFGLNRTSSNRDRNHPESGSGYVPNEVIRLRKWLRDEKRVLSILKSKPDIEQAKPVNMKKRLHAENRIRELQQELKDKGYSYEHGRIY